MRDRGSFGQIQLNVILGVLSVGNTKKRSDAVDLRVLRLITACEQSGAFGFNDYNAVAERLLDHLDSQLDEEEDSESDKDSNSRSDEDSHNNDDDDQNEGRIVIQNNGRKRSHRNISR